MDLPHDLVLDRAYHHAPFHRKHLYESLLVEGRYLMETVAGLLVETWLDLWWENGSSLSHHATSVHAEEATAMVGMVAFFRIPSSLWWSHPFHCL